MRLNGCHHFVNLLEFNLFTCERRTPNIPSIFSANMLYAYIIWAKWIWTAATTTKTTTTKAPATATKVYQCRLRGFRFAFVIIVWERETLKFYFTFVVIKHYVRILQKKNRVRKWTMRGRREGASNLYIVLYLYVLRIVVCACECFFFGETGIKRYIFVWITVL